MRHPCSLAGFSRDPPPHHLLAREGLDDGLRQPGNMVGESSVTRAQLFPTIIIVLMVGSAVVCATTGDWRRAIFWGAAAVVNASVTW